MEKILKVLLKAPGGRVLAANGGWSLRLFWPFWWCLAHGLTRDGRPGFIPILRISAIAGVTLFLIGGLLFAAEVFKLGPNFTPVPFPKSEATLVETGPYGFVRHPMYSGAVLAALGWALWVHGWLTISYAVALFLFFDIKSRREEKWLIEKFSGYESYQRRVRKLIPYIY